MENSKIGFLPAVSIVIANMIGVGVFTSLGFQLLGLQDYRAIVLIWVVGGVLALLGSLCYAELSSTFPKSGGEYHFLRISFGKYTGFLSGWTSAIVGFAAPIAAAAHAFAQYFENITHTGIPPEYLSAALIIVITLIHARSIITGSRFQVYFTFGKVVTMILFIIIGLFLTKDLLPIATKEGALLKGNLLAELKSQAFWVGLVFVSYAYSGWNASAYMIDDIKDPIKNVPRSILAGTLAVIVLYSFINYVFLKSAPAESLSGKEDVANVAASFLFGPIGGTIVSGLVSFFLISTISSMVLVGPRVIKRISQDYDSFTFFAKDSKNNVPLRALALQSGIALFILFTSSFEFIITSIGFILTIFTTLTAAGLIIMRYKAPTINRPVKSPLYPLTPLLYCFFNIWIMYYTVQSKPTHVLVGVSFLAIGSVLYLWFNRKTIFLKGVAPLLLVFFLFSCNDSTPKTEQAKSIGSATTEKPKIDSTTDLRAAILAGERKEYLSASTAALADRINESWKTGETKLFTPIKRFCIEEGIDKKTGNSYGVFYPFSGPDLLFVQSFYPNAKLYLLIGLEKAGDTSSVVFSKSPEYETFIKNAGKYFYVSSRLGFFRTIDMAKQFSEKGVADVLAFYLKRNSCDIISMDLMRWNDQDCTSILPGQNNANVCYVKFYNPQKEVAELYYFSKDLSDQALQKDSTWLQWIEQKLNPLKTVSLTKSASYLMHLDDFSIVRNFILTKSSLQIQDDSGIGFSYIVNSKRSFQLYGTYTRTISLFAGYVNSEMRSLYTSGSAKTLPFSIGYNTSHGESNLQIIY